MVFISRKRLIAVTLSTLGVGLLMFLGMFAYYSYNGPPDTIFFRRTERQLCLRCGTQALVRSVALLDDLSRTEKPEIVVVPKLARILPENCQHSFQMIAADDGYLEFKRLQWRRWTLGKIEGDPFWSAPSLTMALATLSETQPQDASELFGYVRMLLLKGRLTPELQSTLKGTNPVEVLRVLTNAYTNGGNTFTSTRKPPTATP